MCSLDLFQLDCVLLCSNQIRSSRVHIYKKKKQHDIFVSKKLTFFNNNLYSRPLTSIFPKQFLKVFIQLGILSVNMFAHAISRERLKAQKWTEIINANRTVNTSRILLLLHKYLYKHFWFLKTLNICHFNRRSFINK